MEFRITKPDESIVTLTPLTVDGTTLSAIVPIGLLDQKGIYYVIPYVEIGVYHKSLDMARFAVIENPDDD